MKSQLDCELENLALAIRQGPTATSAEVNHIIISAAAAGDNTLISPPGQPLEIMELVLLNNVGAQTIILKDGALVPLVQMTSAAAGAGYFFGFAANNQPHFRVSAGNALVLNLSVGSQVDGFVKYRIAG